MTKLIRSTILATALLGLADAHALPLYQLGNGGTYNPSTDKVVTIRNGGGISNPDVLTSIPDTTNAANISAGTLSPARLPAPTGSSLGGVQSLAPASHQFLTGISPLGVPSQAQPAFTDVSGNVSTGQMNGGTNASSTTFWRGDGTWATPAGGGSSPGGTSGQLQYNNAGSLGGFILSGDCSLVVGTGVITCGKTGGVNFAASATTDTTSASNITSGILAAARGGAGSVNGLLKANGSGLVSAAVAGTDYQAPLTLTTTGGSGAATLSGNTLNIPQYAGGGSVSVTSSSNDIVVSPSPGTGTFAVGSTLAINNQAANTSYTVLASDAAIPWSGRFRGAKAESRARILEGYRKSGQALLLRWSTYRYRVVVQSFRCDYQQPFEIPYSISCLVVADESAPALFGISVLDELIGSDLGNALGLSDSLGVAQIATAVTTAQQAISAAGTLRDAPTSTFTQIAGTLGAAQQAVGASITGATAAAATATPVTTGGNPAAMASGLTAQASAFGQLNQLYQLSGTITRMTKNITA